MLSNIYVKRKALFEGFSIAVLVLLVILIIITSITSDAPLFLVVVGFSPSIIAVVLSIIFFEESRLGKIRVWITPFVVVAVFFLVATNQGILSSNLEVSTLVAVNIIICVVYLALALLIAKSMVSEKKAHVRREQKNTPQTIKEFISSIEDKSKAINFVIGRVYNKYHGGSKEMRDLISIKSDWYNEFSDILKNEDGENKNIEQIRDKDKLVNMLYVVNKIYERLLLLKQTEKGIFGTKSDNLKNLDRERAGTQPIIEVMKKNDKDPVESYHQSALQMCGLLKEKLNSLIKK